MRRPNGYYQQTMTDPTYTLHFDAEECTKDNIDLVGGKNASLGELMDIGEDVQVPPGFAVTTDFYEAFLDEQGLREYITDRLSEIDVDDEGTAAEASEDIRKRIKDVAFPDFLVEELEESWDRLQSDVSASDLRVAVRSSATAEDLPDSSFAGQQDTYLNVRDVESILQRTKACMASLFTTRAIVYREENGFDHDEVLISVGIQKMVDARTSGVMFTLNPANGDMSKVRIEANWGLGESVVSGRVTPDSFLVDKPVYKIVDRDIQQKGMMITPTDNGIEEATVEDDKQDVPSLTANEIIDLTDLAKSIEKYYGEPQDIEWAIEEQDDDTQVFILQSRPETAWKQEDGQQSTDSEPDASNAANQVLDNL
ncbi:phosphoenolpyruvate synthase [Natronococcus sp. JC468]|nr:phosphoenolpyruvate synthase [Natronococcus sp. JC468]